MLQIDDIVKIIDVSVLRPDITLDEVKYFIKEIKKYRFICCFTMPCYTKILVDSLNEEQDILVGGVVGYPTGADTTESKIAQAKELKAIGCNELDMVINVGFLKSGMYKEVEKDIESVFNASRGLSLKVILEVTLLTDDEIKKACDIILNSGAEFAKTATGWIKNPTSLHHIKVIKKSIGDKIKIKAAGGINSFETLLEMYKLGVSRFGIGLESAIKIMNEAEKYIFFNKN